MGPSVLRAIMQIDIRTLIDVTIVTFCMLLIYRIRQYERIKQKRSKRDDE